MVKKKRAESESKVIVLENPQETSGKKTFGLAYGGFALLAATVLLVAIFAGCTSQDQGSQSQGGSTLTNGGTAADPKTSYDKNQSAIAAAVADGNYAANVTYQYHSGNETVEIKLAVKDDVITAASVTAQGQPTNVTLKIVGKYNDALPGLVVGKKITELDLPKNVAGSSLTNAAFKQYVAGLVAGQ